jgi:TusE/DsrC/DsvC family sulfur relay protein
MPTIELAGNTYEVDEDGFLPFHELDKWSEEFAQVYANQEGIKGALTEDHWKLIHYLRNYFQLTGVAEEISNATLPAVRKWPREVYIKDLYPRRNSESRPNMDPVRKRQ